MKQLFFRSSLSFQSSSTSWTSWILLAFLSLLIASCANGPSTTKREQATTTQVVPLTPAEKKTYQTALAQIAAGELDKAEMALNKLTQDHGGQVGLWVNLGTAYYRHNKIEQAAHALSYAQQLNANLPDVLNLSGLIAVEQGKYTTAEKNYLAALASNDNYAEAHYNLALLYDVFYQDINKAIPHYERYLALITTEDKETEKWLEELKQTQKRKG